MTGLLYCTSCGANYRLVGKVPPKRCPVCGSPAVSSPPKTVICRHCESPMGISVDVCPKCGINRRAQQMSAENLKPPKK